MIYLYIFTVVITLVLFIVDKNKTTKGIKVGIKKFLKILPVFLTIIIYLSIILYVLPDHVIAKYLGKSNLIFGTTLASIIGSITIIPGFISYPLAKILLSKNVSYTVIATFTLTLMMVGVVTYPVEKKYFGKKIALTRNILAFVFSIISAIIIGLCFGELL